MKSWIFIPVALLLGMLIGSWGPRSDLNEMKREVRRSRKLLSSQPRGTGDLQGVTRLLGIDGHASKRRPASKGTALQSPPPGTLTPEEKANRSPDNPANGPTTNGASNALSETAPDAREQKNMEERINEAMELWKTRSDVARSTLMANLHLSPAQAVKFDVLVGAMNVRIGEGLKTFAEDLEKKEEMLPEDGIQLAHQVTSAIVVAYNDMDQSMPAGWRRRAGSKFAMTDFVDPNVARPLLKVEDKLKPRRHRAWGTPAQEGDEADVGSGVEVEIHD